MTFRGGATHLDERYTSTGNTCHVDRQQYGRQATLIERKLTTTSNNVEG